jgi:SPP1 family predicted phage head-tail adaptor
MNIGKLKTVGKLQSPPTAQDADGQPTGDWTDVAAGVWADIRILSGLETIKGGAETGVAKASIRIRARSGVTNGMRYLVGTTAYNFKSVPPHVTGAKFMDIVAEVVT